jgi:hypothetical protein
MKYVPPPLGYYLVSFGKSKTPTLEISDKLMISGQGKPAFRIGSSIDRNRGRLVSEFSTRSVMSYDCEAEQFFNSVALHFSTEVATMKNLHAQFCIAVATLIKKSQLHSRKLNR